ncbi:MAG: Ribosomal RNA small subunit methyltransferase H [Thermocaproicibacter melissae]|uniref:16S rRNA (cytosine(1402)-N(4))-methyltransferase RsmH n=1 Tax=Thermocaproicibacter melissae TaxID=2966552 RepID=UPI0024B13A00|nr:16S rRNA (cytosine(1402)-N(4))-methyltransferase RsmH [Thermocaproicibacter melissae]WBY64570.1 16S rRNA (cytosine(1402)-N(4))-methyltransferase RsmH [Thermocaproicibacter melissae]
MEFTHKPVLFDETIESLSIKPDGVYIDGTAGGGGHSRAIAEKLTTGRLLAIDQDPDAIQVLKERLGSFPCVSIYQCNFAEMKEAAAANGINEADGVLLDIGISSYQVDNPERGFSYHHDAPLDMRMSKKGVSAKDIVNTFSWQELAEIISKYGEEKYARQIAQGIVRAREKAPVETTLQLAEIVKQSVPAKACRDGHPARKTFQALRIQVNGELDKLSEGLDAAFSLLKPGGRLAVITFHSLEDRIVKQRMADWCKGCICPPDFPVCVCGRKPQAELLYKKGLVPSEQEIKENPRSRSARLRVCVKL